MSQSELEAHKHRDHMSAIGSRPSLHGARSPTDRCGFTEIGGETMGAKRQLNRFYGLSALLIAGLIGVVTQSWVVFWIAWAALLIGSIHAGNIRR